MPLGVVTANVERVLASAKRKSNSDLIRVEVNELDVEEEAGESVMDFRGTGMNILTPRVGFGRSFRWPTDNECE